jgi:hypothetical protein
MLKCFNCQTVLAARGVFCKNCGNQVVCKNCNDILEPDANVCVICGVLVGEGELKSNEIKNPSQPINTFEFKETRNERTAKAVLTNESVENLKDTLSLVVSSYPLANIVKKQRTKQPNSNGELFPEDDSSFDSEQVINITPRQITQPVNNTIERLKELFYSDGDKLVLEVQDIKASGAKDFGVRLVYLRLLYSKEVDGEEFLFRDTLNATLKEVMGILDPNVVNWVSKNNDLALKQEGDKHYVRLKSDGYKKAISSLDDIYNPDLVGSFIPEKKSRNSNKSSKTEGSDKKKTHQSNENKSNYVEDWMQKWKEQKLDIDLHEIGKKLSVLEKFVLGLWVIYKATLGNTDTSTTTKVANFIKAQFVLPVTRQYFDQVLKKEVKGYVMKTPDGWKITPTGIKHAESLVVMPNDNSRGKSKK